MDKLELKAAKQVLADEFGLIGIDDPSEVQSILKTKLQEMNPLDRAALTMRLGQEFQEAQAQQRPSTTSRIVAGIIITAVAWFIWRPIAAVVAIFATGNIRYFVMRRVALWSPHAAVIFGAVYGVSLAAFVRIIALVSVHGLFGNFGLVVLGLFSAGYIGYGIPTQAHRRLPEDEKRIVVQGGAFCGYVVAVFMLFFGPSLWARFL